MRKQEILNIAKELILISGKYNIVKDVVNKEHLLAIFNKYEKQLLKDKTKYSEVILGFLLDLKGDLENNRNLNINNLNTDKYLENYLLTKNEINKYNSLIGIKNYRNIFNILNSKDIDNKKIDLEIDKLITIFTLGIKKINSKIIAENLLIFISLNKILPKNYLINLYIFLKINKQKKKILDLIKILDNLIKDVKKHSIKYYKNKKFNYKYIGFKNINGKSILADKIIDCSKLNEKTGFAKYEYLKLIKKL